MHINKDKFADIENAFIRLQANDSDVSATSKIADALRSLTGKNFTVNVIKPTSKNQECRIMSVYPKESTIDAVIDAIVSEKNDSILVKIWNETMEWIIEIDSRILSSTFNMTEKELTALLMHEVGHIIYSNSIPMRISRVVRFEYAKSNFVSKQLLKDNFFSKLISFPILHACNANVNKTNMRAELQADKYSVNAGYGEHLKTAMDKVLSCATSEDTDKEMKELMGFAMDSLNSLQKRQNVVVRRNIGKMIASTPSRFAQSIIIPIQTGLSGSTVTSMTESVKDKYIANKIQCITDEFYASEAFFSRVHKLKRIDPADIDYIGLEVNAIKSNDDKMMIVSYIYNKLDTIDYYIALIDTKNPKYSIPHSREALVSMRDTLMKYKEQAINRKLPEVNYGVNIQYPSGYEG